MESPGSYFAGIFTIILGLGFLVLLISALRWCINDAQARNKSAFAVCCAVFLFFPWGWFAWLIFRPDIDHRLQGRLKTFRQSGKKIPLLPNKIPIDRRSPCEPKIRV